MGCRNLFLAVFFVLAIPVWAADAGAQSDAPGFGGKYVGYGYVYDAKGAGIRTDVRMDIQAAEAGGCVVELNYGDNKTAKFGKAALVTPYRLEVDEEVRTGGPAKARAKGQFLTLDGSSAAGSVEILLMDGGTPKRAQAMKVFVLRLKEKPAT